MRKNQVEEMPALSWNRKLLVPTKPPWQGRPTSKETHELVERESASTWDILLEVHLMLVNKFMHEGSYQIG